MKKLTKLAALLLAGAMALVLFTACSGDNSTAAADQKAEQQYMAAVNANRSSTKQLSNDAAMQQKANNLLDTAVDTNTGNYSGNARLKVETGWERTAVTAVVKCDYAGTNLENHLDKISFGDHNLDLDVAATWSRVGVVVKTIKGQTYIAVAVEIDNPLVRR